MPKIPYSLQALRALARERDKRIIITSMPGLRRKLVWMGPEDRQDRDQEYAHETEGYFNVSKIRRDLASKVLILKPHAIHINESVRRQNENADVNPDRVSKLTQAELLDPGIFIECDEENKKLGHNYFQADGQHRLRWYINRGFDQFPAVLLPFAFRRHYECWWYQSEDGERFYAIAPLEANLGMWGEFAHHDEKEMARIIEKMKDLKHEG